jgi:hypothetical protein
MFMGGGMALQTGIEFAEAGKLFYVEIAGAGQRRIKNGGNMTIAEKEEIFIFAIHVEGGIMLHDLKIQGGEKVGTAQGTPGMTAGSPMDHSDDIPSDLGCNCF